MKVSICKIKTPQGRAEYPRLLYFGGKGWGDSSFTYKIIQRSEVELLLTWTASGYSTPELSKASIVSSQTYIIIRKVIVAQSYPTLCDPMDYTFHGILQPRILEWVALSFSRGTSQPRDRTQVFRIGGGFFTSWATREAQSSGEGYF